MSGVAASRPAEAPAAAGRGRALAAVAVAFALLAAAAAAIAYRGAIRQENEKLLVQADTVRSALASVLASGAPVREFSGFPGLARSLTATDKAIDSVLVADQRGEVLFEGHAGSPAGGDGRLRALVERALATGAAALDGSRAGGLAVAVPMADRLGTAGVVVVTADRGRALAEIARIAAVAAMLLVAIAGLCGLHYALVAEPEDFREARGLAVLVATPLVVGALVLLGALYAATSVKASERAEAFAASLAARLDGVVGLGVAPEDLSGLDAALVDYRSSNPDVAYVAILTGNSVLAATDQERVGTRWSGGGWPLRIVEVEVRPRAVLLPQLRVAVGLDDRRTLRRFATEGGAFAAIALVVIGGAVASLLRPAARGAH